MTAEVFLVVQRAYGRDEPITVQVVLANPGKLPLKYHIERYTRCDLGWHVTDANGATVPLMPQSEMFSVTSRRLMPGAAVVDSADLRDLFELPPGRYTVHSVRYVSNAAGGETTAVRSADFTFERF